MKLEFSYKRGRLDPIIVPDNITDVSEYDVNVPYIAFKYKKNGSIHISLKHSEELTLPPEDFLQVLIAWQEKNLITPETAGSIFSQYEQQFYELPYLGKEVSKYDEEPRIEVDSKEEITHLKNLKQHYKNIKTNLAQEITYRSRYWLAIFREDVQKKEEYYAKNLVSLSEAQSVSLKTSVGRSTNDNSKKSLKIPTTLTEGKYSIAQLILMNLFEQKNATKIESVEFENHFINQICENPRTLKILLASAFWSVFGVDLNHLTGTIHSDKLRYLKIIANTGHHFFDETAGGYDKKATISVQKVNQTLIHELIHAIFTLMKNNQGNSFEKNSNEQNMWNSISEKFMYDLLRNCNQVNTLSELIFSDYAREFFISELLARWFKFTVFNPQVNLPISIDIKILLEKTFEQLSAECNNWCESFISENGLGLLDAFKNNSWQTGTLIFSRADCELINMARKSKITVLDAKIQSNLNKDASELIEDLIKGGIESPNILVAATKTNKIELVQAVLKKFKFLPNKFTNKAFFYAGFNKNLEMVKLLLNNIKPLYEKNTVTILHHAASNNWIELCEELLKYIPVDAIDKNHMTPLHYASFHNHYTIAQILIKNNASVNAKNIAGKITLCMAEGDENLFNLLLGNNTDINSPDRGGFTAIHGSIKYSDQKKLQFLLKQPNINVNKLSNDRLTPLYFAVLNKNFVGVQTLCEDARIDPNVPSISGFTPLLLAIASEQLECSLHLLTRFETIIDINYQEPAHGKTALHIACEKGQKEIVELLLKNPNVDYKIEDKLGFTAYELIEDEALKDIFRKQGVCKEKKSRKPNTDWFKSPPKEAKVDADPMELSSQENEFSDEDTDPEDQSYSPAI